VEKLVYFTPFPYFSFFQTQIFLGRMPLDRILTQTGVLCIWIIVLFLITKKIWQNGLRDYTAAGQ
jgi:ABC-type uncharacterized transport system permease subunit